MADNPTRPARLGASLVVLCALVVPLRATAAPRQSPDALAEWAAGAGDRFLYWGRKAAPAELADALDQLDAGGRFIVNLAWGDMTGDHNDDVLAVELDSGPGGLGLAGVSTTFRALDGRNGNPLWNRTFDADFLFPIEVSLGKKARAGVLVATHSYEDDASTFIALDHRGRRAYRHTFVASTQYDDGWVTGREEITSFTIQDSLRGRADDVLIGISDVRRTPAIHPDVPSIAATTTTRVIDGRTGKLVEHAERELGVGRVPVALPASDLDGDGLEDHLISYVLPEPGSDEESGLPTLPSLDGGELIRARRGTDGTRLWTSPPLELDDGWDAPPLLTHVTLGDQTSDGHAEVLLGYEREYFWAAPFYFDEPAPDRKGIWSLSGRNGDVLWHRPVNAARVLEDVDGDKQRDVVLLDDVNGGKRSGTTITSASGLDARRIYSRFFPIRKDDDQTVESSLARAGDLQPDRVSDFVLYQALRRDFDNGTEWTVMAEHLFSGATGAKLGGLWSVSPIAASVDGRGDDLIRWTTGTGVEVVDGRTRALLIAFELDVPVTLPTEWEFLIPMPARLNRDRCVDFVGTLMTPRSTFAVGVDGGTGRLMWAKRQQGLDAGGPITQTRRVDHNAAC